ncbi:MAG: hypothetical protein KJ583_04200 [Nanoarchaeota archaeon]|nr:hypothetical protein [Nanoarchaeota archaeon]MBU1269091.1 hypothetical protein [Nanoarchaeota archaeon]MBU1604495.1 hypothetical protein [Nanoarchaeota archaeon]MBU2442997.1 hypothetical protein [Nanoarchaeota archaeon]
MNKRLRCKKGQIAVEYLFILALALAIIVPGSMLFFNYSKESNEKLTASQVNKIGNNIVNQAEDIYTIGKNSWTTIQTDFPTTATNAYVVDDELVITYNTPRGTTEGVFFSNVPIQGGYANGSISPDFHHGFMSIRIESKGDYVLISEVTT